MMEKNLTTKNDLEESLKEAIKYINILYPIILSVASTIGNILSFIVFSSRVFQNNGASLFLKLKSIIDILNVYLGTLRFTYLGITNVDLKNVSRTWCFFITINVYIFDSFSSWLNVFVSIDRVFLVYRPSTYKSISRKNLLLIHLLVIFITFSIIIAINMLKFVSMDYTIVHVNKTVDTIIGSCVVFNSSLMDTIHLIMTLILPFIFMGISSSMLVYQLIKSSSNVNRYKQNRTVLIFNKKNVIIIKTVLCLDICFLVFNLPRFIFQYLKSSTTLYILLLQLATVFKYSYYSFSIVFYIFANHIFRTRTIELFLFDFKLSNFKKLWT